MKFLIFVFSLIIFHPFVLANTTKDSLNKQDKNGWTALHLASFIADSNIRLDYVKFLLKKNADPNIRNNMGRTPFHFILDHSTGDILELVRLFFAHKANPHIESYLAGTTPATLVKLKHRKNLQLNQIFIEELAKQNRSTKKKITRKKITKKKTTTKCKNPFS